MRNTPEHTPLFDHQILGRTSFFLLLTTPVIAVTLFAQQNIQEPSTGKLFPPEVSFRHEGRDYRLQLTGLAVRKKFLFKVYGIAHYLENPMPASKGEAVMTVLTDGKAKQITMDFARDVDASSIVSSYRDAFKANASDERLKRIQPSLDRFLGYFTRNVKENDQFILRWLPGGTIVTILQGEEHPAITDTTFAPVLWSVWLGENSVVDRDDLVFRIGK